MLFVIPAVVLVLIGLYFWLIGHWFARVVMLPVCAAVTCYIGAIVIGNIGHNETATIWGAVIGLPFAWPLSGVPIYVRRHQARAAMVTASAR